MTGQIVKVVERNDAGSGMLRIGVELSDLPAGTYVCTVQTGDRIATKKLIVR